MKMFLRIPLLICMVIGMVALSAGCSAKPLFQTELDGTTTPGAMMEHNPVPEPIAPPQEGISEFRVSETQKMIKRGYVHIETTDFSVAYQTLLQEIKQLGGYVENSNETGNALEARQRDTPYRTGNYTLRIPQERYDEFYETGLVAVGNILFKRSNLEDVTGSYVDLEARLKTLKTEEARLLQMLEQAEQIGDLITIESRLSEVRFSIESYESSFQTLKNSISYSTLQVELQEVSRFSNASYDGMRFSERIENAFRQSMIFLGDFAQGAVLGAVFLIPILILPAIILVVAIIVIKNKKHRKQEPENK